MPPDRRRLRASGPARGALGAGLAVALSLASASCGGGSPGAGRPSAAAAGAPAATASTTVPATTTTAPPAPAGSAGAALPVPAALAPFARPAPLAEGTWKPAGRPVGTAPALYETTLVPPGGSQPAGIAWMDTHRLSARLYSGSKSPGGGPYRYTAPIRPADAATLVAAFNGGFIMNVAGGGYYTEGRTVDPLVAGAASLVVYTDGSVDVGAWGSDVSMSPRVASVRQNLQPLVAGGQPTPQAASPDWQRWGATCGVTSCSSSVPGLEHQWRSGAGVTSDGALVYAAGPGLDPLQLAQLLVRAGVVRGMQLDINPDWTVLVTYSPPTPDGPADPANGAKLLAGTVQGPWTFFEPNWARDFVTMSARPPAG